MDKFRRNIMLAMANSMETGAIPPNNEIWYTSTDGNIVTPHASLVFGANIVSNTYDNNKGVILFDNDINRVGNSAFLEKFTLKSISLPNSVISIGNMAFFDCTNLINIAIPENVISIGTAAFYDCMFTSIIIPDGVTELPDSVFDGCIKLSDIIIPDTVTNIGTYAFNFCENLSSITIPSNVQRIGSYAFQACSGLSSVTISNGVNQIEDSAFRNCISLSSIVIPNSVERIGNQAFHACSNLMFIYVKPTTPPTGGNGMFSNINTNYRIYVPVGSSGTYKNTLYWADYASRISEYRNII